MELLVGKKRYKIVKIKKGRITVDRPIEKEKLSWWKRFWRWFCGIEEKEYLLK